MKEPSDEFMDAVRSGSSIRRVCSLCGRTCFEDDPTAGDWEKDELEELRENAEKYPDKYVALPRVETGVIDGKDVVVNCPCNNLRKYEDWIWAHRHIIARYIAKIAQHKAEEAYSDEAEAEALHEGVTSFERKLKFVKCSKCHGYFPDELLTAKQGELYCEKCIEDDKERCIQCQRLFDKEEIVDEMCEKCRDAALKEEEDAYKAIAVPITKPIVNTPSTTWEPNDLPF